MFPFQMIQFCQKETALSELYINVDTYQKYVSVATGAGRNSQNGYRTFKPNQRGTAEGPRAI